MVEMIELQELNSTGLEVMVGNKIYHFDAITSVEHLMVQLRRLFKT